MYIKSHTSTEAMSYSMHRLTLYSVEKWCLNLFRPRLFIMFYANVGCFCRSQGLCSWNHGHPIRLAGCPHETREERKTEKCPAYTLTLGGKM